MNDPKVTRILLVDDHEIVRFGLVSLLEKKPGLEVVGQAGDGIKALELAHQCQPDIIVMDISMPKMNGVEAARQIKRELPDIKIIVMSMYNRKQFVLDMLSIGISGYILKSRAVEDILPAIEAARGGDVYLSPKTAKLLVQECVCQFEYPFEPGVLTELSARERQVLQLLAEGSSSKQIATTLNVSENTVVTHRQNIMNKLNLRSVAQLTKYAVREGITDLEQL